MSIIKKGDIMIMLKDQTRQIVTQAMRRKLLEREHFSHNGITKMRNSLRTKYFWPGMKNANSCSCK